MGISLVLQVFGNKPQKLCVLICGGMYVFFYSLLCFLLSESVKALLYYSTVMDTFTPDDAIGCKFKG